MARNIGLNFLRNTQCIAFRSCSRSGWDYCLLIGNIGDRAADEVLQVAPLYIN